MFWTMFQKCRILWVVTIWHKFYDFKVFLNHHVYLYETLECRRSEYKALTSTSLIGNVISPLLYIGRASASYCYTLRFGLRLREALLWSNGFMWKTFMFKVNLALLSLCIPLARTHNHLLLIQYSQDLNILPSKIRGTQKHLQNAYYIWCNSNVCNILHYICIKLYVYRFCIQSKD